MMYFCNKFWETDIYTYMKKIHILNSGDSVETLNVLYSTNMSDLKISKCCLGNYVSVSDGTDDYYIVQNYNPIILYRVKPNETMMDIITRGFEVVEGVVEANEYVALRRPDGYKHRVKPAENLAKIANMYGVTTQSLIEKNNLKTVKLYVGQILNI